MIRDKRLESQWKDFYCDARNYFERNGSLDVSATYISESGKHLGRWISCQRKLFSENKLSAERISMLNSIHMIWDKPDAWMIRYGIAKKHGGS